MIYQLFTEKINPLIDKGYQSTGQIPNKIYQSILSFYRPYKLPRLF